MAPKKPDISDEERDQFQKAMENPFQYAKTPTPKTKPESYSDDEIAFSGSEYLEYLDDDQWLEAEDLISFARQGLQNKLLKKFNKGELAIAAKLDLHGLTAYEATQVMRDFLNHCQQNQIRSTLIVHGKGKFGSSNRPILKNVLNQWLPSQPQVLAIHSALPKHGGRGAVYVLIKQ